MAKRGVIDHPKFNLLKRLLDTNRSGTLGYLECLWQFAGRFAPQGNIGRYSDEEIEAWLEWDGAPGGLIEALVKARWLDRSEAHRLLVHDWADHVDHTTRAALRRAGLTVIGGDPLGGPESDDTSTVCARRANADVTEDERGAHAVSRAMPEPEPGPEPEPREAIPAVLDTPGFRAAWADWLRHRRQIRHPLKPMTEERQLAELARHGPVVAVRAIEDSIRHGWQGLFPEKGAARAAGPPGRGPDGERARRVAAMLEATS
ncbi:MAG: hypothetical protein KIS66_13880 [Fimbriimonadaceae bacterium]|nr:hypothetical protein [Fimbriimonadaceae bacterium]